MSCTLPKGSCNPYPFEGWHRTFVTMLPLFSWKKFYNVWAFVKFSLHAILPLNSTLSQPKGFLKLLSYKSSCTSVISSWMPQWMEWRFEVNKRTSHENRVDIWLHMNLLTFICIYFEVSEVPFRSVKVYKSLQKSIKVY